MPVSYKRVRTRGGLGRATAKRVATGTLFHKG